MANLTEKRATSNTTQIVTLIVDDSGSMGGEKANQATAGVQDLIIQMQVLDKPASGHRFLINVAKFGDSTTPLAVGSKPKDLQVNSFKFGGDSGNTNMPDALRWGANALRQSLEVCRQNPNFEEHGAPSPVCIFFSDGANNRGGEVDGPAAELKSVPFAGGGIDIVACGIGMEQKDFPVMQKIASRPDLAVNIDPNKLFDFLAKVAKTMKKREAADAVTIIKETESLRSFS